MITLHRQCPEHGLAGQDNFLDPPSLLSDGPKLAAVAFYGEIEDIASTRRCLNGNGRRWMIHAPRCQFALQDGQVLSAAASEFMERCKLRLERFGGFSRDGYVWATVLWARLEGIIGRYGLDLIGMTFEIARVLKPGGRAIFVVGNSCIKGKFIDNAKGVATAAQRAGMAVEDKRERELPMASRYLPVSGESLSKRMRTETVLVCSKPH